MSQVEVLGVRHHGPGSARAVVAALDELRPDVVLVEGPADADPLLAFAAAPGMEPPVALFAYDPEDPARSAFWPFAVFSPEWQAIRWASIHDVPVRFCDLPARVTLAEGADTAPCGGDGHPPAGGVDEPPSGDEDEDEDEAPVRRDPLAVLAHAAGYDDPEAWWDDVVESRGAGTDRFAAIGEAMAALRAADEDRHDEREERREAFMRQQIRAALKAGAERVVVVCGAWHVPALTTPLPPVGTDAALLRGLTKRKIAHTWVPWTHSRLAMASGYGAGVESPGWYHHLFTSTSHTIARWLTRVAAVLREEDLPISSAHVIESTRLATALAALRSRPVPGLAEVCEATQAVMCDGDATVLDLVTHRLVIGEELGRVPDEVPQVPLETDLVAVSKRLRLKRQATERVMELDLRKDTDAARSRLLYRLTVLGIDWATRTHDSRRARGTFRESWSLAWRPELAIAVVEASRWGSTVDTAATARLADRAATSEDLGELAESVDVALLADLGRAVPDLLAAIERRAALDADVVRLMAAVPPLVRTARYGDVRGTDTASVHHVVAGLATRVCVGVGPAACGIDPDAARTLVDALTRMNAAVGLYDDASTSTRWFDALATAGERTDIAPLVAGWIARTLLDAGRRDGRETATRMRWALSRGADATERAGWIEGFLGAGGELLVHDTALLGLLDEWVCSLPESAFVTALPLLRRTFARFEAPVRRMLGARVRNLADGTAASADDGEWAADPARGDRGLDATLTILGVGA